MELGVINKLEQYYGLYKLCNNYINIQIPGNTTDDAVNKYNIEKYRNIVADVKGCLLIKEFKKRKFDLITYEILIVGEHPWTKDAHVPGLYSYPVILEVTDEVSGEEFYF